MKRYVPVDIFRGLTIAFMIIVNTSGDWSNTYSLLLHAEWHGFTPTDLVFPSFLFAVGNAMAFVASKWSGIPTKDVFLRGLKRASLIFLIGYLLYWIPFVQEVDGKWVLQAFSETRIFGVLQRIGFCYFLALPIVYYLSKKQVLYLSGILLIGYWIILNLFGDLTLKGNAALLLDLKILGANHMYKGDGIPFDPEGLLSSVPSVVNILGGYLVGLYIKEKGMKFEQLAKLLLVGVGLVFLGYLWNAAFPINKKIWTSSYVALTVGLDIMILSLIIYAMDFSSKKFKFGIFNTFGKNPLFVYVLSALIAKTLSMIKVSSQSLYQLTYQNLFEWIGPNNGSLAFALFITTICWLVAKGLEMRNIYIRI